MPAELIVALDVPSAAELPPILDELGDRVSFYKLGLELFCAEGPAALDPLKTRNKKIFLDLKLHDIPRTVERAVRSAATHGVDLLTVHAAGGCAMLEAAAKAAEDCGSSAPKLIAVTTLTSLNEEDFADLGIQRGLKEQALALGKLAIDAGIDGLVTSAHEVQKLRSELGPEPLLVTPGIRLPSDSAGDQKRVATPESAVRDGASHLVVGRTIMSAEDRAAAAEAVLASMKAGTH
jgi:orotidine-5'-phosphate decarboxylase